MSSAHTVSSVPKAAASLCSAVQSLRRLSVLDELAVLPKAAAWMRFDSDDQRLATRWRDAEVAGRVDDLAIPAVEAVALVRKLREHEATAPTDAEGGVEFKQHADQSYRLNSRDGEIKHPARDRRIPVS